MLGGYYWHNKEYNYYHNLADETVVEMRNSMVAIISELRSLGALHQTSFGGFNHLQYQRLSQGLIDRIPLAQETARYEIIKHKDLDSYRKELQYHGVFEFQPKFLDSKGQLIPLDERESYTALIDYYPANPITRNNIGLDLNQFQSLHPAVMESVSKYNTIATAVPEHWPGQADTILMFPTYLGQTVPLSPVDRQRQTDGGYLLTLDIEQWVTTLIPQNCGFSASIAVLHDSSDPQDLFSFTASLLPDRILHHQFKPRPFQYKIKLGATPAQLTLAPPSGIYLVTLMKAILLGAALLALYILLSLAWSARRATSGIRERALVTLCSIDDAVITADKHNCIDYVNPAARRLFGNQRCPKTGSDLTALINRFKEIDPPEFTFRPEIAGAYRLSSRARLAMLTDPLKVVKVRVSPLYDSHSNQVGTVLAMSDISTEHALSKELAYQAMHDPLTGIANRRQFEHIVNEALCDTLARKQKSHAVAYIDLDQFKLINDTAGHASGDKLLINLATEIQSLLDPAAGFARLGGDEFGLFLAAESVADINRQIQAVYNFFQSYHFQSETQLFKVRASIGLAHIRDDHKTVNDVLSEVDLACYAAKDSGRNNLFIYDPENTDTKERHGEMQCLPILQAALKNNSFSIYVQAIVKASCDAAEPTRFECLLRIPNQKGEPVAPYRFILAAERYDMMRDIDRWVIDAVFRNIAHLDDTPAEAYSFAINLSGQSATDTRLPAYIDSMLIKHKVSPKRICFELTETAVISNMAQAQELIRYLRAGGFSIALDDFGSGASSFGYLKHLQVDYLKIDGQFVKEITTNPIDLEMVRSINNVGHALGIKTIAEFVETRETMKALEDLSVDYAQGYYINRPYPMSQLLELNLTEVA
ncbi:hypothetical protein AB833_19400 [Chromatiales bacterium (ex Bugula neritina AB1)]|nr:hypothetical protein AB833_19400 [Chromatiales bacterium (ex Bugula neritina AB1)]